MEKRRDIHNYEVRVKKALEGIRTSELSKKNKETLEKFYKFSVAQQITAGRIAKHLWHLLTIGRIFEKNFEKVKRADVENLMVELQKKDYKDATIRDFKVCLKKFYNWLRNYPPKQYPPEVSWLKTANKDEGTRDPSSDLTIDEIKALASVAEHPRDKALIWVIYETAARIGELMDVKLKHLSFGQVCTIKLWGEKVNKWREVPIVDARADLATWLDIHPHKNDSEAYLWTVIGNKNHGLPLAYHSVVNHLRNLAKKAGIKKPINPHSFRHSRLSFLGDHLTDSQLGEFAGWRAGSKMTRIYVRPKMTNNTILGIYGIHVDNQKEKEALAPKTCKVCTMLNAPESKYCRHCGTVIDIDTAISIINGRKSYEKVESELYSQQDIVKQAVKSLQQNPALVEHLKASYPGYWEMAVKKVMEEMGGR